jgi:hypothetical protein
MDALVPPEARDLESMARQRTVHVALRLKGGKGNLGFNMISRGVERRKRLGSVIVRLMICCGSFSFYNTAEFVRT